VVEDSREWKVVRSQHRDRLPRGLHAREIGHANFVLRHILSQTILSLQENRGCRVPGNPASERPRMNERSNHSESRSKHRIQARADAKCHRLRTGGTQLNTVSPGKVFLNGRIWTI